MTFQVTNPPRVTRYEQQLSTNEQLALRRREQPGSN
jgi:hypothetical protein